MSRALSSPCDLQASKGLAGERSPWRREPLGRAVSEGAGLWRVRPGWVRVLPEEEKEA